MTHDLMHSNCQDLSQKKVNFKSDSLFIVTIDFQCLPDLNTDHSIVEFSDSEFLLKVLAFVRLFLWIWSGKQVDLSTDSMVFLPLVKIFYILDNHNLRHWRNESRPHS